MSAKWFTEDMHDQLLGYGIRSGHTLHHLTYLQIGGPGAIRISAVCHGIQGVLLVDSRLDVSSENECRGFYASKVRVPIGQKAADALSPHVMKRLCPRCETIHAKRLAKEKP